MKTLALASLLIAAGCGGAGSAATDSGPPDSTPAPSTITITGTIREGAGLNPSNGTTVSSFQVDETTAFTTPVTTNAAGMYTLVLTTGGHAPEIVGRYNKTGFVAEWLYPGEPLTKDLSGIDGVLLNSTDLDNFAVFFGPTRDPATGVVAVLVLDAAGMPAMNATVTLSPPPDVGRYASASGYPSGSLNMTSTRGIFYGWNEPIAGGGNTAVVTVSGMYMGAPLKSHTMKVHKGEISLTLLHP